MSFSQGWNTLARSESCKAGQQVSASLLLRGSCLIVVSQISDLNLNPVLVLPQSSGFC